MVDFWLIADDSWGLCVTGMSQWENFTWRSCKVMSLTSIHDKVPRAPKAWSDPRACTQMAALGSPRGKTQHLGCHSAETRPQGFDLGGVVADAGSLERVPAESIAWDKRCFPLVGEAAGGRKGLTFLRGQGHSAQAVLLYRKEGDVVLENLATNWTAARMPSPWRRDKDNMTHK